MHVLMSCYWDRQLLYQEWQWCLLLHDGHVQAFDLVKWSVVFVKLINTNISSIFIRIVLFIYVFQSVNVRWNGSFWDNFSISNGWKQGMVLSAIFYCCYCSGLFQFLEQRRSDYWVKKDYMGVCAYSNDNLRLAPSLDSLQEELKTSGEYPVSRNLEFGTNPNPRLSKTGNLSFLRKDRPLDRQMVLCGNFLPWEYSGKYW